MQRKLASRLISVLIITAVMLAACSNSKDSSSPSASDAGGSPSAPATSDASASPTAAEEAKDPLGKYPEPVTVTMVLGARTPESKEVPAGLTPDQNGYLKKLKEMTNIEVKYDWTVPYEQFTQKFKLSIASGDLPDVMYVDQITFEQFKAQGVLGDLTQAYEDYASPTIKKWMAFDDGASINMMKSDDGKLLGLPSYSDANQSLQTVWIRADWLKNVGLEAPQTFEDLEKIADAFTHKDPDQDGKADTYGLALMKTLNFWGFDARGFFNMMGAYPYNFIKGTDGGLVAGEMLPETKNALAKLAEWYKNGLLDKEWAFKDENKVVEDMVAGKVGMSFGEWWYPNWPLNLVKDSEPKAEWINVPLPSYNGNPGKSLVPRARIGKILVVNKDFAHPEAAIKMANFYPEMTKKEYLDIATPAQGFVYEWYEPRISNPTEMETNYVQVNEALKANDDNYPFENGSGAMLYETAKKYAGGDAASWGLTFSRASEDGGWGVTRKVRDAGTFVRSGYAGPPTPTQVEKGASLLKLTDETFTKIIMGSASVDAFDKFAEDWKKLGGNDILKEVNDWYAKNPME
ncbi:extracellular solute-binding protein [Paenibacillus nasutitermitis]|uniref:Lipoprotein LipO n=1 Tax=Paenibacillus nasutitermitis TaxID=1652958 RepID=A0A916YMA2_9BACL|nr:extracellular solute-binding protein [Paenibacillus nasutitermitis]GGD50621.1 lipoprotein LipO [Paenibacillus nasutitermitis]